MTMLKRQRELQKAEKAAIKRARREGRPIERPAEPTGSAIPRAPVAGGTPGSESDPEPESEAQSD